MMKCLAISDTYIPQEFVEDGLVDLADHGIEVEVRHWHHESLIDLQEDNLAIETGGPDAVTLPDSLLSNLETFHLAVVQFAPVGHAFVKKASSLQLIGVLRGGTENVVVDDVTERGITVMNTPGRNARAVAECTLGMILAEVRNIARSHGLLKQGQWTRSYPNSAAIPELQGKTVGLVGYGQVARLLAGYLHAMGCTLLAYDPYCNDDTSPVTLVDLPTLLQSSDIVSINARLTEESLHMIGEKELAQMQPHAILVNTARSGLIDEPALVRALQKKRIMGAALDVFDTEPLPADHPLLHLENVTVTPHIAGSTIDAFKNSPRLFAGHLIRALQGEKDLPVVNGLKPTLKESLRK